MVFFWGGGAKTHIKNKTRLLYTGRYGHARIGWWPELGDTQINYRTPAVRKSMRVYAKNVGRGTRTKRLQTKRWKRPNALPTRGVEKRWKKRNTRKHNIRHLKTIQMLMPANRSLRVSYGLWHITLWCRNMNVTLKADERKIEPSGTRFRKRTLKISWTDKIRNEDILSCGTNEMPSR